MNLPHSKLTTFFYISCFCCSCIWNGDYLETYLALHLDLPSWAIWYLLPVLQGLDASPLELPNQSCLTKQYPRVTILANILVFV